MHNEKSWIPKSEKEFIRVKEGNLVKISFSDSSSKATNGFMSKWARYVGLRKSRDYFSYQEAAENGGNNSLVVIKSSQREVNQYDETLGVILSCLHENTDFLSPRNGEEYIVRVNELKKVGLWRK